MKELTKAIALLLVALLLYYYQESTMHNLASVSLGTEMATTTNISNQSQGKTTASSNLDNYSLYYYGSKHKMFITQLQQFPRKYSKYPLDLALTAALFHNMDTANLFIERIVDTSPNADTVTSVFLPEKPIHHVSKQDK